MTRGASGADRSSSSSNTRSSNSGGAERSSRDGGRGGRASGSDGPSGRNDARATASNRSDSQERMRSEGQASRDRVMAESRAPMSRAEASRFTSSMQTTGSSDRPNRTAASSPSRREPSQGTSASAPMTRAEASRFTSSMQTALTTVEFADRTASLERMRAEGQGARDRVMRETAAALTRAEASRFTSSMQTTPAGAPRDWTPEERAALDRGTRQGVRDAGADWLSDALNGIRETATLAARAVVAGVETISRNDTLRSINPVANGIGAIGDLIPDAYSSRQEQALRDTVAAAREAIARLPEVPAALRESYEADFALADAMEAAYRAGRADLSVLEESARVRAQAVTEIGILAAETGSVALAGAGLAAKAVRSLGQLDLDLPGGMMGALSRATEVTRGLADDLSAFARDESGAVALGRPAGDRLTLDDLAAVRAERTALAARRYEPGTVTGQGQPVGADWMRQGIQQGGAPVPDRIAARLAGREFADFDAFREAFWREVAADPDLAGQFSASNRVNMAQGRAPFAPDATHVGARQVFELDHVEPLFRGGIVYDIDNLQIMTPRAHIEKTRHD